MIPRPSVHIRASKFIAILWLALISLGYLDVNAREIVGGPPASSDGKAETVVSFEEGQMCRLSAVKSVPASADSVIPGLSTSFSLTKDRWDQNAEMKCRIRYNNSSSVGIRIAHSGSYVALLVASQCEGKDMDFPKHIAYSVFGDSADSITVPASKSYTSDAWLQPLFDVNSGKHIQVEVGRYRMLLLDKASSYATNRIGHLALGRPVDLELVSTKKALRDAYDRQAFELDLRKRVGELESQEGREAEVAKLSLVTTKIPFSMHESRFLRMLAQRIQHGREIRPLGADGRWTWKACARLLKIRGLRSVELRGPDTGPAKP